MQVIRKHTFSPSHFPYTHTLFHPLRLALTCRSPFPVTETIFASSSNSSKLVLLALNEPVCGRKKKKKGWASGNFTILRVHGFAAIEHQTLSWWEQPELAELYQHHPQRCKDLKITPLGISVMIEKDALSSCKHFIDLAQWKWKTPDKFPVQKIMWTGSRE